MSYEKTSVLAYNILFEGWGIVHSNGGLQVRHTMFVAGYFILLFDLTLDFTDLGGQISHLGKGNIRVEFQFYKPLSEATRCLIYFEYVNCVRIDQLHTVFAEF